MLAWAGDGGTFDIGIQALSGAAERNEDIIFVCYDNEAYMNTGIQRSSATPLHTVTTTSPASAPKPQKKKDIVAIMAAHGVPYTATASIAYPADMLLEPMLKKAKSIRGHQVSASFRFLPHRLAAYESDLAVGRWRPRRWPAGYFPLYEVFEGDRWQLSDMPDKVGTDDYLNYQGRFENACPNEVVGGRLSGKCG